MVKDGSAHQAFSLFYTFSIRKERERQRLELRVERFRGEILNTGKKIITEGWFISINGVLLLF